MMVNKYLKTIFLKCYVLDIIPLLWDWFKMIPDSTILVALLKKVPESQRTQNNQKPSM